MSLTFDPNYYRNVAEIPCQPMPEMPIGKIVFGHTADTGIHWISADRLAEKKMTEYELLEELAKELGLPDIDPEEVTAQSVADYTGCSWTKAAATLKAKLAAGELTARQVRTQNGKPATAYRKVK